MLLLGCRCDSPAITFVFLMLLAVDFLSLRSDCEYLCVGQR